MEKKPPYNTGKVLIGIRYQPPPLREYSRMEERLQSAFLAERRAYKGMPVHEVALYAVCALALIVVVLTL